MKKFLTILLPLLFFLFISGFFEKNYASEIAKEISGYATVIDGDTILINNIKIRLYGIDSPEQNQTCFNEKSLYSCGQHAKNHLYTLIKDRWINCITHGYDGRHISICKTDSYTLNQQMVREGWAIAYKYFSKIYTEDENIAKYKKLGLWRGHFIEPWQWRKTKKAKCFLKGNIENEEKILYLPYMKAYNKTQIFVENNEKWFCTIYEAYKNGWIPYKGL